MTDVRDVHDVMNFVAEEFQSTANHVGEQERAEVSDVSKVIDRRPAAVHSHAVRFDRLKCFGGVRERVVEPDFHRSVSGEKMRLSGCTAQGLFSREDSKTAVLRAVRIGDAVLRFSRTVSRSRSAAIPPMPYRRGQGHSRPDPGNTFRIAGRENSGGDTDRDAIIRNRVQDQCAGSDDAMPADAGCDDRSFTQPRILPMVTGS